VKSSVISSPGNAPVGIDSMNLRAIAWLLSDISCSPKARGLIHRATEFNYLNSDRAVRKMRARRGDGNVAALNDRTVDFHDHAGHHSRRAGNAFSIPT
jgi:hypothetical protein